MKYFTQDQETNFRDQYTQLTLNRGTMHPIPQYNQTYQGLQIYSIKIQKWNYIKNLQLKWKFKVKKKILILKRNRKLIQNKQSKLIENQNKTIYFHVCLVNFLSYKIIDLILKYKIYRQSLTIIDKKTIFTIDSMTNQRVYYIQLSQNIKQKYLMLLLNLNYQILNKM
ncbi:hypothetical protein TTHERM_001135140 (macronuclear) [Tetrahymena thermophila SB210]|uniref:Uncharacterized protein n=1 Tax=Tetrahymena thermophila (strain SB210) TaxID=312017 RepID=W7XJ88_TETTS|nr:hypothetical protein TTHERM_001135140 [Tetrahymena thermophila SB210]EWS75306.1 hypothetical protein TTHERM_001135140 [Tetrahymena thermophila SB210]|eukprot:XP_012652161.1 hypothetical protein TTHERM_001135140 [Tetrahymena thermophila SB210]